MLSLSNIVENFINNDVLKCGKIPKHVAFVMDGNRRYSKLKGIPRKSAYFLGAENLVNVSFNKEFFKIIKIIHNFDLKLSE